MELFFEIYGSGLPRQGLGDNEYTRKAFSYLTNLPSKPYILDVGCGSGMQTLELARLMDGKIFAIDNHQEFLDALEEQAKIQKLNNKITTINQSMFDMEFESNSFDIIWSEGAVYIYGFEKALKDWQDFLKEKGYFVLSEATWFKEKMPKEIYDYWMSEYPDIKSVEENIKKINSLGLHLISHFKLPEFGWVDNYYVHIENNIKKARKKYQNDEKKLKIIDDFYLEIEMYRKYSDYYGYTFFIIQKD